MTRCACGRGCFSRFKRHANVPVIVTQDHAKCGKEMGDSIRTIIKQTTGTLSLSHLVKNIFITALICHPLEFAILDLEEIAGLSKFDGVGPSQHQGPSA